MDSFLVGFLVFAISTTGAILWTALTAPHQLAIALRNPRPLIVANVSAAVSWIIYLLAVQMIEPAVVFTIFCGAIPLTTILAARLGVPEANGIRGSLEGLGNLLIFAGMAILAVSTLLGYSGFVRGGLVEAMTGLALAASGGVVITWMLFACRRLDRAGVGPVANFGLRFVLYVMLAGLGAMAGLDHKASVPLGDLLLVVAIGLLVMSFPLYAVQKAIPLVSTLTIGAIGALGPLGVFLLQLVEGRVDYAPATLAGFLVYFIGALAAAYGGAVGASRAATVSVRA